MRWCGLGLYVFLLNLGLIKMLCVDAWNSIEPGEKFEIPFQPKIWSVDPIDKIAHKVASFISYIDLCTDSKLI